MSCFWEACRYMLRRRCGADRNDESASFWLQEYDLNSGQETDKAWYPDESGLIEVPLLDRTTKNNSPLQSYTEYGIALKDVDGLDPYKLSLILTASGKAAIMITAQRPTAPLAFPLF